MCSLSSHFLALVTQFPRIFLRTLAREPRLLVIATLASVSTRIRVTRAPSVLTPVTSVPGGAVTQEPDLGGRRPHGDTLGLVLTASEITRMIVTVPDAFSGGH